MPYYKFLRSDDIDKILKDYTVKISALTYFRAMEEKQWIADKSEGSVHVTIPPMTFTGDEALAFTPEGFPQVIKAGDGGKVIVTVPTPAVYSLSQIPFIFSACVGQLSALRDVMLNSEDGYDACVKITDMHLLAHRVLYHGTVVEMDHARVSQLFYGSFRCERVRYQNLFLEAGTLTQRPPAPDPFLKHNSPFQGQSEMRIAFVPRQHLPFERLTVKLLRPGDLFVEEFRRSFPSGMPSQSP